MKVPARAGTGTFAVSVNSSNGFSASPLTVTYNLSNVTFAPPDGFGSTTYSYRPTLIDYDGGFAYSPEVDVFVEVTGGYHLSENYPNPFNPTTTFALILSREQQVRLEIFDLLGRRVALLHEGSLVGEKSHAFRFNAAALSSGIYLIRATGETFATTRPITLVK